MGWLSKYTPNTEQKSSSSDSSSSSSWLGKYNSESLKSLNNQAPASQSVSQPVQPEKKGFGALVKNIAGDAFRGTKQLLPRVKNAGISLLATTADFVGDFLARTVEERSIRSPVGSDFKPKNISDEEHKRNQDRSNEMADRWATFYDSTLGAGTERFKEYSEKLRENENVQPTAEWSDAPLKEKFKPEHFVETLFFVGPEVVASMGAFALNPTLGFAVSSGSVADEIKTIAMENGMNEDTANILGIGTGFVVGILDKIVPDELFSPQQKSKLLSGTIKRVFKTTGKEVATEVVQEDVQIAVESTLREDLEWEEVKTRNVMSALGGAIGGSGTQIAVDTINSVKKEVETIEATEERVFSGRPVDVETTTEGQTFFSSEESVAQEFADNIAKSTKSEVVTQDIKGKNLKEVTQKTMQDAFENPKIREEFDGVKFEDTRGGTTTALFNEKLNKIEADVKKITTPKPEKVSSKKSEKQIKSIKPKEKVAPAKIVAETKPKVIKVPSAQLPIGQGKEKVSRLGARLSGRLDLLKTGDVETAKKELGLATYNSLTRADQKVKVSEYVANNTEEAIKVNRGEIEAPPGMLNSAIYLALKELARGDTALAQNLAGLRATRQGQEINYLQESDPDNPVTMMEGIVKTKIEAYESRTGKKLKAKVDTEVKKISKEIKTPTRQDWNSFLESIKC